MYSYSQNTREITCPKKHTLVSINSFNQPDGTNKYMCNLCRNTFDTNQAPTQRCFECNFDMCPTCYNAQRTIQMNCPKDHPLFKVANLQLLSHYSSNRYKCNACSYSLDNSSAPSAHCPTCFYDLCPNCLSNSQANVSFQAQSFQSYQPQEQVVRAGNYPSIATTRQITCQNRHVLIPVNNIKNLHPTSRGVYASNKYACDTCRVQYDCSYNNSYHCQACKFDMCPKCYEAQKTIQIDCPKNNSHPLFKVSALKLFSNYTSNRYRCNSCSAGYDATIAPAAHCRSCKYDLCPNCLANSQPNNQNIWNNNNRQEERVLNSGNPYSNNTVVLSQVTCLNKHVLSPVNNIPAMHPTSKGSYAKNVYFCDTCRGEYNASVYSTYHCQTCKFDMCPGCHQQDQRINFGCPQGHHLYFVRALNRFHESTGSYRANAYICNSCRGKFDAAKNPSCHCKTCKFDLCSGCFETKRNEVQQQAQYQYQNQQPFINHQQQQQQYNSFQQNFANMSIQEPVKQQQPLNNYQQPQVNNYQQSQGNNYQPPQMYNNNNYQQPQTNNNYQNQANNSYQAPLDNYQQPQVNNYQAPNNEAPKRNIPEEMLCVLCLDSQRTHLFTPCMHLCACETCCVDLVNKKSGCPMCRAPIQSSVKVFMS